VKRQLYIMVKEPQAGRVKTRLGKEIGYVQAAWWFRHQCRRLIRRLAPDRRWDTILSVAPDVAGLNSRIWPAHLIRQAQGNGDLGQRMARIFRQAPAGPVLIVGSDIPDITPTHIAAAFVALGDHDAVFGPAPDGGFWLVGLKNTKAAPPNLFQNVRWSSEHALLDSIATLGSLNVAKVAQLRDVDAAADLQTRMPA
jgi:rSAM/selenodomain-associated transferase 1